MHWCWIEQVKWSALVDSKSNGVRGKAKEVDGELKSNDETGKQRRTKEDKEAGGQLKITSRIIGSPSFS